MSVNAILPFLFAALQSSTVFSFSQTNGPPLAQLATRTGVAIAPQISALAQGLVGQGLVPGMAVAVVDLSNGTVSAEFGAWGNRTEEGDLATPETLFPIGSCSKAFMASAFGILMDDFAQGRNATPLPHGMRKFTYETKIQSLFPGDEVWKLKDEWATKKANVRDLLSHVTGVTRNEFAYSTTDTVLELAKRFRYLNPGFEFREEASYMNLMYYFGAHIISTYSKKSYQDFVKERIFDPLNMSSTNYSPQEANATGLLSQSWAFVGRRIPLVIEDPSTANLIAGAGGIISNVVDMAKWAATVLNRGVDPVTNNTIIPKFAFDAVTTPRVIESDVPKEANTSIVGYGMGWERKYFLGHDMLSHDGGFPGFVSRVMVLLDDNLALVSLANTDLPVQAIIPLAIIQSLLEPNASYDPLADLPTGSSSSTPPSDPRANCSSSPAIPIERFAGTYVNPGYGNVTFCAPSQANISSYCKDALFDFASISADGTNEPHTLVAVSPRIATHVSMQRTCLPCSASDGQLLQTERLVLNFQSIYSRGYGRNTAPFTEPRTSLFPQAEVECALDREGEVTGCGWLNLEPGNKREGALQERADVWWDRRKLF
ncbi:beta-lactamase/transpeptidase-like protein [Fomes fomentarius]|nr:beta-lactamase/transpeptidase-like protein [Fomes fomentarius]